MSILAFLSVLRARSAIIFWAVMVAMVSAVAISKALPENFAASAKVQVNALRKNPLTGSVEPVQRVSEFLGQQAALVDSRTVGLHVVNRLAAENYLSMQDYEARWREETGGELLPGNELEPWIADQLMEKLDIGSNALESTLTISYRAEHPSIAARYANAFADAYMSVVMEQRKRRAQRNAASFSEETKTFEQELEAAREEMSEFQQQSGMVTIGTQQLESAEVELSSLTNRLSEARADAAEAQALYDLMNATPRNQLITIPLPANNLPGRAAQSRLASVNAQMEKIAQRYGNNHPDYLELREEQQTNLNIIYNSIRERWVYTKRRAEELAAEVEQQKQVVVGLYETKQKFEILENSLNTNSQAYDLVAARQLQESLQSRLDLIDVFLLSRAVPASKPIIPRNVIIAIVCLIAGFGIGVGIALLVELAEGRVRTRQGLKYITRAPVLAEVSLKSVQRGRL
ncbi:MAG: Wzz/FepE/Etk N-terminal domain-containing protein [bacterium]